MNKDILQGDWNLVKGKVKEKWGKLTDDDLTQISGKKEQLLGAIQKKYGVARDRAEKELAEWSKSCCSTDDGHKAHDHRHHGHDDHGKGCCSHNSSHKH